MKNSDSKINNKQNCNETGVRAPSLTHRAPRGTEWAKIKTVK
jgi:hypothetical protein